ncbi:hypothetical protein F66182_2437 [Fusarium sp. NRRL 66182]|nr:hypothetical protein F66182_2437 [Fusarium sp. NRRL 66182]
MAFQSSVLRDGEWVTQTVSFQDALKASSAAPKTASDPYPEAPACGILSRTLIESPVVHWVLPAWLRSRSHNDIAFVGDRFVQISELRDDGQVHEIIRKTDFGTRIRNATVLGALSEGGPDGTTSALVKPEDTDVAMRDVVNPDEADVRHALPPQLLVLMLETGDAVFLFIRERAHGTLEFVTTRCESPKNLQFLGFHLSIDPSSRYMAAGSAEGAFVVYELESLINMDSQFQRYGFFHPVKSTHVRATQGIIHKMEFLHPRLGDDYHVILLLIVIRREASKQAHVSRMIMYDWELGDELTTVFRPEKGAPLPKEHRMPLMIIPLKVNTAFFAVSEHSIGIVRNAFAGQALFDTLETHSPGQTKLHHGAAEPLWTAWARPFRLNRYLEKTDIIYLAREDGVIAHIEVDSVDLVPSVTSVGTINTNITTAFTTAYDIFSDVFIIGGDSGPGGIWKLAARSDPQHVSAIPNWSPVVDLVTTDINSSWAGDGARKHVSTRRNPPLNLTQKPDRVFCTSGRGPRSSLTELRWGIQARIGLEFEYDQPVRQSWMFQVEIEGERGFYAILSLPHSSDVLHFPADLSNANALSPDACPFDTSSRTVSATQNGQKMIVQVTETCLFNISGNTYIIAGSVKDGKPRLTVYSLDGREVNRGFAQPDVDGTGQESHFQMEAYTSFSEITDDPDKVILAFGTRSGHLVTIQLSGEHIEHGSFAVEQLGISPASVFAASGPFGGSPALFACCDNNLSIAKDFSARSTKFQTRNQIWATDSNDPSMPSPPIHSVFCLESSLSGYDRHMSLMLLAGTRILLVDIWPHVGPVPRSIPLDGTPMRVIYSQSWKVLVVANVKNDRPTLSFIDPDSGADVSAAVNKEREPMEYISGLGHPGDRIFGLYEWLYVKDGQTFPFIIVTTQQGRLIIVSVSAKQVETEDGPTRQLQYWTKYKKGGFIDPIYAVIGDAVGLLFCAGKVLHWEVLDLAEKKLKPMKQFRLDSPATSLRVEGSKVCALTAQHSLQVIDLHVESEHTEASIIHTDRITRYTGHVVEMGDSEEQPGKWPVSVISTPQGGFAGVWIPWGHRNKEFEVVFEGVLPTSIRRFRKGHTRPFWLAVDRQRRYNTLFSTADQAEILGISLDGSLQHFALVGMELWRFLRLIQNLAYHSMEVCPFRRNKQSPGDSDMEFDMELELEPQPHPKMMHIDGDLLKRCLDLRALKSLVSIGDGIDLFCEYLDGIEEGMHTKGFREYGSQGQEDMYLELGYEILDHCLAPFSYFIYPFVYILLAILPPPKTTHPFIENPLAHSPTASRVPTEKTTAEMPPKKKGNKKNQQDDWEAELGESIAPPAANANGADGDANDDDDEGGAGGLMATLRKNKEKRKKKGIVDTELPAEEPAAPEPPVEAPAEANMDDEFALPDKKAKGGKQNKQPAKKPEPAAATNDAEDGRILTKAEKEKLKKEREKQRKKEQAAAKKKGGAAPKTEPAKPAPEEKEEKAAPAEAASAPEPAAGGKKKKIPAALAALQKQQEDLKRQREEQARLESEAKAQAEEEDRIAAEEEKRREEAKALKKQKERERIEQLKKEGKYLTKAQKEEKARNERKLQQMLAAGIQVGPSEPGEKKAKPADTRRKKGRAQQKADEEKALAEAAERARLEAEKALKDAEEKAARDKAEAEAKAAAEKKTAESDVEDDWEAAAASDADVKDSWDADSEEEANGTTGTQAQKESEEESEEESSDDEVATAAQLAEEKRKREAAERREKAHQAALAARSKDNLRSPICCILGHVDTGKTKLLDKIRQTNVQEGEAGGITQQIGATYFPLEAIKQKTAVVNQDGKFEYKVPGLLVIDTPGHESFSNLRSRGSSLCNIAILVVDIMHGLEPQTLESMRMLKERKTPFIVALNKIDRLYGWKQVANNGFQDSLALQSKAVRNEFETRLEKTKVAFAEQGFNSELFYQNKSMSKYVSLVPTSAHTGEGVPDMLKLIVQLTQERMVGSLMYLSEVQATVLEVKAIEGFGMTIDVVLSNGILREGDRIVLCGTEGAIKTNIRALLTPAPLRELRLKSAYVHNKEVKAALGVKISAPGLEGAIAGSRLMVVGPDDDEDDIEDEVESDLALLFNRVEKSGRGVSVQASTLGSLEALLDFLKDCKIPVANVGIGPVYKRDVMQCGIMLEKAPDYAIMLCFDVKVDKEAQQYAEDQGIKIFTADIIYHLFDAFTKHMDEQLEKKKEESKMLAVFPCVLKPVKVFNKNDPIVIGVDVTEGQLRINCPVAAVRTNPTTNAKEIVKLGRVTSIEREHKQIPVCKRKEPSVAIKIEMGGNQPMYGRHLEEDETLYSLISRASIDTLKEFYRSEVSTDEWQLIIKLKPLFDVS